MAAENTNPTEVVAVAVAEENTKRKEVAIAEENTKPEAVAIAEENNNPKEVSETKDNINEKKNKVEKCAGILSIIIFVLSFLILALGIEQLYVKDYDCERLLGLPKLQVSIAIGLIVVSFISILVVYLRSQFPVPGFFMVMVPLIVIFNVGLSFVGAYTLESRRIMASPMWFREKVRNNDNWGDIKPCIFSTGICDDLALRTLNLEAFDFKVKKLSPIESGCCKPPSICQMEYVNATFWTKVEGRAEDETKQQYSDCNTWQNDRVSLCYGCESCKEGFARTLESKWWKLGIFLILLGLLLAIAHLLLFVLSMWEHYVAQPSVGGVAPFHLKLGF